MGSHGRVRLKTPLEMGWMMVGGTMTEVGLAALPRTALPCRWVPAARHGGCSSFRATGSRNAYTPKNRVMLNPPFNIKKADLPRPKRVDIRGRLKDIEERYRCLESPTSSVPPAQAAIESQFLAVRPSFVTVPPPVTAGVTAANDYPLLDFIAATHDKLAAVKRLTLAAGPGGLGPAALSACGLGRALTKLGPYEQLAIDALMCMPAVQNGGD